MGMQDIEEYRDRINSRDDHPWMISDNSADSQGSISHGTHARVLEKVSHLATLA